VPFQRPAPTFRNVWFEGCWLAEAQQEPTTGGDGLFLEVRRQDGQFLLLLIDVAGHDLIAAEIGDFLEGLLVSDPQCRDLSPEGLLSRLNVLLQPVWANSQRFVAALALRLDGPNGRIEGNSAGQPAPLVGLTGGLWSAWNVPGGPPLGVPSPTFSYARGDFSLPTREEVLFFTDGVTEAGHQAHGGTQFQHGPLQAFLTGLAPGTPAGALLAGLWEALRQHAGAHWPEEDVTVVALRRR
jgi:serine phosphatase RsbU (regulator of sigma subunit)